jgi:uncharacterized protein (DUF433 family)
MARKKPFDIGKLIECTPGVYGGRPCLAGTRFPILQVAAHYNAGLRPEQFVSEHGLDLTAVYAGIAYYLANRPAVDQEIEAEVREYDAALAQRRAERAKAPA